jgi:hypothetical protein
VAIASWRASITTRSSASGLRVFVTSESTPQFSVKETVGHCRMDARALVEQHLKDAVNTAIVVNKIKPVLEGFWRFSFPQIGAYTLSQPVFTIKGDLILQLTTYVEGAEAPSEPTVTMPVGMGVPGSPSQGGLRLPKMGAGNRRKYFPSLEKFAS